MLSQLREEVSFNELLSQNITLLASIAFPKQCLTMGLAELV